MRAQLVNEKFEKESDPIKDLGIGVKSVILPTWVDLKKQFGKYVIDPHGKKCSEENILMLKFLDENNIEYEIISVPVNKPNTVLPEIKYTGTKNNIIKFLREIFGFEYEEIQELFDDELNEKFKKESDPIKDMDIGMTPRRRLDALKKELKKFGIDMSWNLDRNQGKGYYYMIFDDDDHRVGLGGKLTSLNLQGGYITDEAAMAEYDTTGGFWLATEDGESIIDMNEISHDSDNFIKTLLKIKYNKKDLNREIEILSAQLEELQNAKKFLDNES